MVKTPPNHGREWTPADERKLDKLISQNTPTPLIAHELGRTPGAIYSHVSETDRSVKPTNKSPYNRQQKG